jgi:hypothetical protein
MALFEFLGFGSKRRAALRAFDAALVAGKVNPAYVDDGMRYAIYGWATDEAAALGDDPGHADRRLAQAAALMSYCVIGPSDTDTELGPAARAERAAWFESALAPGNDDSFEARIVKLALAKGIACAEITALVALE